MILFEIDGANISDLKEQLQMLEGSDHCPSKEVLNSIDIVTHSVPLMNSIRSLAPVDFDEEMIDRDIPDLFTHLKEGFESFGIDMPKTSDFAVMMSFCLFREIFEFREAFVIRQGRKKLKACGCGKSFSVH